MSFPKLDGFVTAEKLGSGSYSTVYKAYSKVGGRSVVAIKCVDKSRLKYSGTAVDNLITEIRLLKTLKHPHIVEMKDFTWNEKYIFIVTEYCCGGDLSRYIRRRGRIPERQVLYFLQQLASALKFLRQKGVAHMDLKPQNLLLTKSSEGRYILKVADFGFAQYMSEETMNSSIRGSPLYMAPEMLVREGQQPAYDASVDLWSVGVIFYECLFGKAPYSSNTFSELMDKVLSRRPIVIPEKVVISVGCRDLLTRLLQHDPAARISYEDFFNHEYLDLEHMPSKENYDKAVALIKQAVELDAARRHREALELYCVSLCYLVPVVNAEEDAVRRSALKAKVSRYMQRAEELKQVCRAASDVTPAALSDAKPPPRPRARAPSLRQCLAAGATSSVCEVDAGSLAARWCGGCAPGQPASGAPAAYVRSSSEPSHRDVPTCQARPSAHTPQDNNAADEENPSSERSSVASPAEAKARDKPRSDDVDIPASDAGRDKSEWTWLEPIDYCKIT